MTKEKKEEIVHNRKIVSIKKKKVKRSTKEDKEVGADNDLISKFKYEFYQILKD